MKDFQNGGVKCEAFYPYAGNNITNAIKKNLILSIYENVNNLQANKILKWDCVRKLPFLIYIHFGFFFVF